MTAWTWRSEITSAMVAGLPDDKVDEFITALNDAVVNICADFGVDL
jgi:hypothetical protein